MMDVWRFKATSRILRGLCSLVAVAATAACTTTMDGGKAGAAAEGLIYYLPAPHLYLSPQADGSVVVEVKHLPDPTNAYTLKVNSYLSNATFDIGTSNGLLTSVNLDVDTSGVAASAVAAATDIRKARMTLDKEKETARKTQEDAKRTAVSTAAEAVTAQRETVALLEAKQEFYESHPPKQGSGVDVEALDLQIVEEKLKLKHLEARLGLVKSKPGSTFNDPGNGGVSTQGTAFGPMLFRMLQDGNGVKLVAVHDQITVGVPQAAAVSVSVKPTPAHFVIRKADIARDVAVDLSQPIQVTAGSTKLMSRSLGISAPPVVDKLDASLAPDNKRLTIKIPGEVEAGQYRIDFEVVDSSNARQNVSLTLDWLLD